MKKILMCVCLLVPLIGVASANKDVERHRAIAAAHEAAAKCLEVGKTEQACHKALQAACKGLAFGKYCGMKHEH